MKKLWFTFKILITSGFKNAWWFYSFVGKEKLKNDFEDEDFDIYYPDEEEK